MDPKVADLDLIKSGGGAEEVGRTDIAEIYPTGPRGLGD
jgi:hypothetical protein